MSPVATTAKDADPMIGTVLGGLYSIVEKIGEGGMGAVYEAEHIHLEKRYAVKVLKPGDSESRSRMLRFISEAKAASRIDHPNIVDVKNFDSDENGLLFIVMERLIGQNLAQRLKSGPLSLATSLHITNQLCSALQAAHEQGVVHRDLKPDNVFLCGNNEDTDEEPKIKVLDFGISMLKNATGEDLNLTGTNEILGTPLYMSPEQARGAREVDHRVDVYAVAIILYEMLTGTPPFHGDNQFQVLWKHGSEEPEPPSARNKEAEIPAHVEGAILRGMQKNPTDRFETMNALRSALFDGDNSSTLTSTTATSSAPKSMRLLMPIALSAIAVAAVLFLSRSNGNDSPRNNAPTASAPTAVPAEPEVLERAALVEESIVLSLTSRPQGAAVFVNNERKTGVTPMNIELPKGVKTRLKLMRRGYSPKEHRLSAEQDTALVLKLRKLPKSQPAEIKLDF